METVSRRVQWIILATSVVATTAMFVLFSELLPIEGTSLAVDWKGIWGCIEGGLPRYWENGALRIPPWSTIPLLPLGLLPLRAGWGLLIQVSMVSLVASVPRGGRRVLYWIAVVLLATSYPSLRTIADGNLDGLIVLGCLAMLYGAVHTRPFITTAGVLLATMKPQVTILLAAVLGVYVLRTWPRREWHKASLSILIVVTLTMLCWGQEWLTAVYGANYQRYTGAPIDISISATVNRIGGVPSGVSELLRAAIVITTLWVAWKGRRTLCREMAGLLIAASLLAAPYATGNSLVVLLAIGITPLLQSQPVIGGALFALADLPFIFTSEMLQAQAYHWTAVLALAWAILAWRVLARRASDVQQTLLNTVPEPTFGSAEPLGSNKSLEAGE